MMISTVWPARWSQLIWAVLPELSAIELPYMLSVKKQERGWENWRHKVISNLSRSAIQKWSLMDPFLAAIRDLPPEEHLTPNIINASTVGKSILIEMICMITRRDDTSLAPIVTRNVMTSITDKITSKGVLSDDGQLNHPQVEELRDLSMWF